MLARYNDAGTHREAEQVHQHHAEAVVEGNWYAKDTGSSPV